MNQVIKSTETVVIREPTIGLFLEMLQILPKKVYSTTLPIMKWKETKEKYFVCLL